MKDLLKGIVAGIGAVSPGLSGGVTLVLLGLYEKTIKAISTLFKNFKENFKYLFPLAIGIGIGAIAFIKVIDFMLETFEMQTRFAFFGLILGTIPMFWKEMKKEGYKKKYYIFIILAAVIGLILFQFNQSLINISGKGNILEGGVIGISYAASIAMPGLDSASILSAFGVYETFLKAVDTFDFSILIPAGICLVVGILILAVIMSKLLEKNHAITFSVIFGIFLSIVPSVLTSANAFSGFGLNIPTIISFVCIIIGFMASFVFGKLRKDEEKSVEES